MKTVIYKTINDVEKALLKNGYWRKDEFKYNYSVGVLEAHEENGYFINEVKFVNTLTSKYKCDIQVFIKETEEGLIFNGLIAIGCKVSCCGTSIMQNKFSLRKLKKSIETAIYNH